MSFVGLAGIIAEGATAALVGTLGAGGAGIMSAGTAATLGTGLGAIGAGAIGGAGLGAATSALTGGDPGKGALFGALGGGITGGLGSAFGGGAGAAGSAVPGATTTPVGTVASGLGSGGTGGTIGIGTEAAINPAISEAFANTAPSVLNTPAANAMTAFPTSNLAANAGQVGNVLGSVPAAAGNTLMAQASPYAGSFFANNPLTTIGMGSTIANYLGADKTPTQATPPGGTWDPWKGWYKFNPRTFQAQPSGYTGYLYANPSNTGYLQPRFAEGGIASLASPAKPATDSVDFMGGDMYPTSQQNKSFYATPSQMPTSAQQAMASYEPNTNPLTGEQVAFASGGIADLGGYSDGGRLTRGPGDGMSDSIPASIAGKQEARLADGEFVVPADVVSHLGNGSTDAGAKNLYAMMDKVRKARTGRKSQGKQINPAKYMPT